MTFLICYSMREADNMCKPWSHFAVFILHVVALAFLDLQAFVRSQPEAEMSKSICILLS